MSPREPADSATEVEPDILPKEDGAAIPLPASGAPAEGANTAPVPVSAPSDERALERGDTLTRYMAELRHHAPISREEEHALAVRWVEAQLPQVHFT